MISIFARLLVLLFILSGPVTGAEAKDCIWEIGGGRRMLSQRDMDGVTLFEFKFKPLNRGVTFTQRLHVRPGENNVSFFAQTSGITARYSAKLVDDTGAVVGRKVGNSSFFYRARSPQKITLVVNTILPFGEWIGLGSVSTCAPNYTAAP